MWTTCAHRETIYSQLLLLLLLLLCYLVNQGFHGTQKVNDSRLRCESSSTNSSSTRIRISQQQLHRCQPMWWLCESAWAVSTIQDKLFAKYFPCFENCVLLRAESREPNNNCARNRKAREWEEKFFVSFSGGMQIENCFYENFVCKNVARMWTPASVVFKYFSVCVCVCAYLADYIHSSSSPSSPSSTLFRYLMCAGSL